MESNNTNVPAASEEKTVICGSCGAEFSSALPNCPYCGRMNLPAAEKDYMDHLEQVRSKMEGLSSLPQEESRHHLHTFSRKLLIPLFILLFLLLAGGAVRLYRERQENLAIREETLWQRTAFAAMDEAYAAGDYEKLASLYEQGQNEGHSLWSYKHHVMCDYLLLLRSAETSLQYSRAENASPAWLFYDEVSLYALEGLQGLTTEEYDLLAGLRQPYLDDLKDRFGLSEADLEPFREALKKDGYLSYNDCEQFLKERGWTQ